MILHRLTNLIGAISEQALKWMMLWTANEYDYDILLLEISGATPTAELRLIANENADEAEHSQLDEVQVQMMHG